MTSSPTSPGFTELPFSSRMSTSIPGQGAGNEHGFWGSSGLPIKIPPEISVPPEEWMIGSLLLPTSLNNHHQGAGFHGSPVEANARRDERSCFFGSSSPQFESARTSVGEMPRTSTLCLAQNSHIRSGVG